jgi:hypothetical protein
MSSNLAPLDLTEEVEKYEAFEEKREVAFVKCPHKHTKIVNGRLKCSCGAGWTDSLDNLLKLQKLLTDKN